MSALSKLSSLCHLSPFIFLSFLIFDSIVADPLSAGEKQVGNRLTRGKLVRMIRCFQL